MTLQSLSAETLIKIIDELELDIPNSTYKEITTDVYNKAKSGSPITHKQKRVLVNLIGQPRFYNQYKYNSFNVLYVIMILI
ncbi:hypothetical protein LCM23_13710 [Cytobacillus kochii]|uniref:hypothetical protein n=1 Tax=Cytobacillus kochii TaxID=859143 RepID=UPI001CD4E1A2|nr:hypothetical protein [Cytobacillus kochii]MCA1027152.1 hypothetical protein [Cytobacillus kochii]